MNDGRHKCAYCEKTFNSQGNMLKHRKRIHQEEWLAGKATKEAEKKNS